MNFELFICDHTPELETRVWETDYTPLKYKLSYIKFYVKK